MSLEAMKQAVKAMRSFQDGTNGLYEGEFDDEINGLEQAIAEAEKQEPDDLTIAYMSGLHDGKKQRQQRERNFCERCGKRLGKNDWDIHTCTPPAEAEKQEPVAWVLVAHKHLQMTPELSWSKDYNPSIHGGSMPLYTSPPQRQWVGLTDEEIDEGLLRSDYALQTAYAWRAGVVFAMTKLKEKNNG